jgi:hypothetical protein
LSGDKSPLKRSSWVTRSISRNELALRLFRAGVLQEVLQDTKRGGFLTEVADDAARALDNLARGTFRIKLAQASPFTESHGFRNANQVHVDFVAQRLDELGVVSLVAVLRQDADERLAGLDRLARFTETTVETVSREGLLEHDLERSHEIHRLVSSFDGNLRGLFDLLDFFAALA